MIFPNVGTSEDLILTIGDELGGHLTVHTDPEQKLVGIVMSDNDSLPGQTAGIILGADELRALVGALMSTNLFSEPEKGDTK